MSVSSRIQVVAGILIDDADKVLVAQRPPGSGAMAGYWEFPGGKIETGETPFAALVRELREEIGITVKAAEPFMSLQHDYPGKAVALSFWTVSHWQGEPSSVEGQPIKWLERSALGDANLLPADKPVIGRLQGVLAKT